MRQEFPGFLRYIDRCCCISSFFLPEAFAMTQTLAAAPLVCSSAQNLLPVFEPFDPAPEAQMDFNPSREGTDAEIPEVSLIDVEGQSENLEWFRNLIAMAQAPRKPKE
jgi:hypothetical protein